MKGVWKSDLFYGELGCAGQLWAKHSGETTSTGTGLATLASVPATGCEYSHFHIPSLVAPLAQPGQQPYGGVGHMGRYVLGGPRGRMQWGWDATFYPDGLSDRCCRDSWSICQVKSFMVDVSSEILGARMFMPGELH